METAGESILRRTEGKYVCAECGEVLDVPLDAKPSFMFVGDGGPRTRILLVDGVEIHRCEVAG